jgi:hypothetical protein
LDTRGSKLVAFLFFLAAVRRSLLLDTPGSLGVLYMLTGFLVSLAGAF